MKIESPADLQRLMKATYALSDQQWAAVTAPLRPTVVIAGAGSGKTTLMAARVVYLVAMGVVRPDQVLGLTFTTKAAAELRQRILTSLTSAGLIAAGEEEEVLEPRVATYNAYAAELIREHGLRIGHEPDTRLLSDASRYQLATRAIDRYRGEIRELSDHPPTVVQSLLALDGAMAEHLITPDQVRAADREARRGFERAIAEERAGKDRKTYRSVSAQGISAIDRRGELLGLVESYRRLKDDLGLMDFSDQIALGAALAEGFPEVGADERDRFRVVLLDEYQDTSVAQTRLLSALFSGPTPAAGLGHPVMAVGDPHQAIYGWRGAAASNMVSFAQYFPSLEGGVSVLPLTVNRRSDRRILEVANTLAKPLYDALDVVEPLESADGAQDGVVETHVFESRAQELAWLVREVAADHEAGIPWRKIAVLTRDNESGAACFDALSSAGVPVEIVGLSGLLRLPEVAEVVACLTLLQDPLANASLVTLLSGARWSIGPRDLSLLAARARELAHTHPPGSSSSPGTGVQDRLAEIATEIDPAEVPALLDALEDPGEGLFSARARYAFGQVAGELRSLRRLVSEPLLDIVRRVIEVTGLELELASATTQSATARRDNLDLLVKGIAEFQSIDGDVSLTALLAYLTAEDEQGNGLDQAVPSEAESVKLMTVHRAKGLEWDSVFVACAGKDKFPSHRGRSLWVSAPANIPAFLRGDAADLPQLAGYDKPAVDAYRAASKAHDRDEELRLAYVALTRAAHRLCVTSHVWGERRKPHGPSEYQNLLKEATDRWGVEAQWAADPAHNEANPFGAGSVSTSWPPPAGAEESRRRREAAALIAAVGSGGVDEGLDDGQQALVRTWDGEIERLIEERLAERSREVEVDLPLSLSATALMRLHEDPEGFTRDLARPMPRRPSPQAWLGTRFHAWVESRFGQLDLLDPDDLPGRGDVDIEDESDLEALTQAFEAGPFSDRVPHAVEAPFSLVLGQHVVRGRIDAVYAEDDGYLVVDWKTSRSDAADPVQLAIYRLAWARLRDVPLDKVRAAFYFLRSGKLVEPELISEEELAQALTS